MAKKKTTAKPDLNTRLKALGAPYTIELVDIESLVPLDRNAQIMAEKTLDQLTANVKADKALSSVPLVRDMEDGKMEVVSGNHRVLAARRAGITDVLVLRWRGEMEIGQRRAIQLSHNALVGKPDRKVEAELFAEIAEIGDQAYSGLDAGVLDLPTEPSPTELESTEPTWKSLHILFLPSECERFTEIVAKLAEQYAHEEVVVAPTEVFERMSLQIKALKKYGGASNSSTAMVKMTEIVGQWLERQGHGVEPAKPAEPIGEATAS